MHNPLLDLEKLGQSVWLDYISRALIDSGELNDLIKHDHLKGVTSNPSIFEKAIAKTDDYEEAILALSQKYHDVKKLFEHLAVKDIKDACDLLHPVYKNSDGQDGFACLEVSPHLAYNTAQTIDEGRRLWQEVDRPNLMIKVPGTKEGMGAIRALTAEGINVNVTLLFSVSSYEDAAQSYLLGLKDRLEKSHPIDKVASVASFFVSRIDSKIDQELDAIIKSTTHENKSRLAEKLKGHVAILNAKIAYRSFLKLYKSDLAKSLVAKGARPQRLLWASTSTKNPRYSDVLYIESLIGNLTINTMPLDTLRAFKDHGQVRRSLEENIDDAQNALDQLADLNIDLSSVCQTLEQEGVTLFIGAFDQLLAAVQKRLSQTKK